MSGIPDELRDRRHELWEDPAAVKALARACGIRLLSPRGHSFEAAPAWARFDQFRQDFCKANGLMNPQWPDRVDQRAGRAAGIDMRGSALERARYMAEKKGARRG